MHMNYGIPHTRWTSGETGSARLWRSFTSTCYQNERGVRACVRAWQAARPIAAEGEGSIRRRKASR